MKANELRPGNLILGVYEQEIDRGNGIIEDVEYEEVVTFLGYDPFEEYFWVEGGGVDDYDIFNPIPLTEEWLKRFGCVKSKDRSYFWHDSNLTLCFNDNGLFIESFVGKLYIKHVHTFQNLYYALTGEELTIKK